MVQLFRKPPLNHDRVFAFLKEITFLGFFLRFFWN